MEVRAYRFEDKHVLTTAVDRRGVACGAEQEDGRQMHTDAQARPAARVPQGRA